LKKALPQLPVDRQLRSDYQLRPEQYFCKTKQQQENQSPYKL